MKPTFTHLDRTSLVNKGSIICIFGKRFSRDTAGSSDANNTLTWKYNAWEKRTFSLNEKRFHFNNWVFRFCLVPRTFAFHHPARGLMNFSRVTGPQFNCVTDSNIRKNYWVRDIFRPKLLTTGSSLYLSHDVIFDCLIADCHGNCAVR